MEFGRRLLPLWPLLEAGALVGTVIADSKSGVSGAGRVPKLGSMYAELAENFYPYGVGQTHRHWPEMRQEMTVWSTAAAASTTMATDPGPSPSRRSGSDRPARS